MTGKDSSDDSSIVGQPPHVGPTRPDGMRTKREVRRQRIALIAIFAALVTYGVLHTALRGILAGVLAGASRGCYLCGRSIPSWAGVNALAALVLIVTGALAAAAITSRFDGSSYERPVVFGVAATSFFVVPAAVLGGTASALGGSYLQAPVGPLLSAVPAVIVVAVNARRGWRPSLTLRPSAPRPPLQRIVVGASAGLIALSAAVSLLHPPTQGDALSYHAPLGVWFWQDGNLTTPLTRAPGTWAFAQPGTNELWAGLLRLLGGGERLADLCQLPTALLGAAGVAVFARRTGLTSGAALLAGCSFLLVPIVALQVGTQANDVTGSAFVIAAVALACAPRAGWTAQRAALIGLALGLAAVTKLALLPTVGALACYSVVMVARTPVRPAARAWAVLLGPLVVAFVLVVAPWWVRNAVREGNPLFPQSLPIIGHGVNVGAGGGVDGDFVPSRAAWPAYPVLEAIDDRSGFGALFSAALIPGLVVAARRSQRRPLLLLAGAFAVTLPFWWLFTLHEPRFFLAHVGLALVAVPWALTAVGPRYRTRGACLLGAAALLSVALSIDQQIAPLAVQPMGRAAFYDRLYAVDSYAVDLPEPNGLLQVTGFGLGRVDYASVYPLLGPGQQRLLVPVDAEDIGQSIDVVLRQMSVNNINYAYIAVTPKNVGTVEKLFFNSDFRLVHTSSVTMSGQIGSRRPLFREIPVGSSGEAIRRYVFQRITQR